MKRLDSSKRFGIIGIVLIVTAYILWAFVLPELNMDRKDTTVDRVTDRPVQTQQNPSLPTGESAMPARP
jgi:hypothetical protein